MKDNKVERVRQKAMMFGRQFLQGDAGVFDRALGTDALAAAQRSFPAGCRERIYAPLDTLRLFVGQVLSADRACQDVVGRRLSERIAQGQSESALTTGSYCEARARLPLAIPQDLNAALGEQLESLAPASWRWQGRTVKLFDGTTVSMPDTPSNQGAYPQSSEQKPGLGFPVARIGALIGLASGAILGYRVVACLGKGVGEQTLLGNLLDHLNVDDVVLADALLATWWIVEGAKRRSADVLMAHDGRRIIDFARGQRQGQERPHRAMAATAQAEDDGRGRIPVLPGIHHDARSRGEWAYSGHDDA